MVYIIDAWDESSLSRALVLYLQDGWASTSLADFG